MVVRGDQLVLLRLVRLLGTLAGSVYEARGCVNIRTTCTALVGCNVISGAARGGRET